MDTRWPSNTLGNQVSQNALQSKNRPRIEESESFMSSNQLILRIPCWKFEYFKRFFIFPHKIVFLWKRFFFKKFNIAINNIISFEVAKVLEYLSLWGLPFAWRFFWVIMFVLVDQKRNCV